MRNFEPERGLNRKRVKSGGLNGGGERHIPLYSKWQFIAARYILHYDILFFNSRLFQRFLRALY